MLYDFWNMVMQPQTRHASKKTGVKYLVNPHTDLFNPVPTCEKQQNRWNIPHRVKQVDSYDTKGKNWALL